MVRALTSHHCGPGSILGIKAILVCGLSLLLVLFLAARGFSPVTLAFASPQKPTLPNSNSIWNAQTRLNEFKELLSASWVNKFQFFLIFTMITCKETQYHQNYHFHTFFSMLDIFILGPSISFRFMCNIPFLKRYWEGLLCEQRFVSCMAVSIYKAVRIAYHSPSFSQGVNKPITWLTSDANDSVNAKSHTRG